MTTPPSTPPGFQPPGQVPTFQGQPLAAPKVSGQRGLFILMAVFAGVAALSAVGFFVFGGVTPSEFHDTAGPFTLRPRPPASFGTGNGVEEPFESAGPVPAPVTYRGTGSKTIAIRPPEKGAFLAAVKGSNGNGLFAVYALDAKGQTVGLVVSAFDPYDGVRLVGDTPTITVAKLKIEATGAWRVQLRPLRSAPSFDGTARGTGDAVLRYTGDGGSARFRGGAAMSPFTVTTYDGRFPRLLATQLGTMNEVHPLPAGPILVSVQTGGPWTITVR